MLYFPLSDFKNNLRLLDSSRSSHLKVGFKALEAKQRRINTNLGETFLQKHLDKRNRVMFYLSCVFAKAELKETLKVWFLPGRSQHLCRQAR